MEQMKGKIVLITDCDNSIGRQTAFKLAAEGATLLLHSQDFSSGIILVNSLRHILPQSSLDLFITNLERQEEIQKMIVEIGQAYNRVDVLINNSSVFMDKLLLTENQIEKTFAINHVACFILAHLLLPFLKLSRDPRIINVSSHAHYEANFDIRPTVSSTVFDGFKTYSQSRLCNLLFTYALAGKVKKQGIKVNAVHPGSLIACSVNVERKEFPDQAYEDRADTIVYLAMSEKVSTISGQYFISRRPVMSSKISYRQKYQQQLWNLSEKLSGIRADDKPAGFKIKRIYTFVRTFFTNLQLTLPKVSTH